MGYTPEEEWFEPSIDKIIEGIEGFDQALEARIKSREYLRTHIEEMSELSIEMRKLKLKLAIVKNETR